MNRLNKNWLALTIFGIGLGFASSGQAQQTASSEDQEDSMARASIMRAQQLEPGTARVWTNDDFPAAGHRRLTLLHRRIRRTWPTIRNLKMYAMK